VALPPLAGLEQTIGHRFRDHDLLEAALTHKSAPRRPAHRDGRDTSYERLEFLGDRVLGLAVAEMLYERFPNESEGALAIRQAELVRQETLAAIAAELGLGRLVRLPDVEEKAARTKPALLADVCEALIGALHRDAGIDAARRFVAAHWSARMNAASEPPKDPKTALQEWAQARSLPLPRYRPVATGGPPHQPVFTVAVEVGTLERAFGTGGSKRLAEAVAAGEMLRRINEAAPAGPAPAMVDRDAGAAKDMT
jgi:ribonuclease-3